MITVTNESTLMELKLTESEAPLLIANKAMFVCDMGSAVADEIIAMFESGEMDSYNTLSIYQYDFYHDIDDFKSGLAKLFEYFIFHNQWFLENNVNIIVVKEEFLTAVKEQIAESQKTITSTDEKWPQDTKQFCDLSALETELRGSIVLTEEYVTTPLEAIRLTANLTNSYVKIKDELDPTKDRGLEIYHHLTHIQHDIVTMETVFSVARFYGPMSTSTREPNGNITFDIWNIIKEEDTWVVESEEGGDS